MPAHIVNRKMILAVLATLLALLAILYNNPEVSGFFASLNEELGNVLPIERVVARNVSFYLESDMYSDMEFSMKETGITIAADEISAGMLGAKVSVKELVLEGFTGRGEIKNGTVYLSGQAENMSFAGAVVSGASLEVSSAFSVLEISGLEMNRLKLYGINGKLVSKNLNIALSSEDVDIKYPRGTFIFSSGLKIDGNANRISTSSKLLLES